MDTKRMSCDLTYVKKRIPDRVTNAWLRDHRIDPVFAAEMYVAEERVRMACVILCMAFGMFSFMFLPGVLFPQGGTFIPTVAMFILAAVLGVRSLKSENMKALGRIVEQAYDDLVQICYEVSEMGNCWDDEDVGVKFDFFSPINRFFDSTNQLLSLVEYSLVARAQALRSAEVKALSCSDIGSTLIAAEQEARARFDKVHLLFSRLGLTTRTRKGIFDLVSKMEKEAEEPSPR